MKQRFLGTFPLLLLLISLPVFMAGCSGSRQNLPPGWQTIRQVGGVLALAAQGDTLWAGGKDGVYQIDRLTCTVIRKLESDPPITYVKALLADPEGQLWIGHSNGLTRYVSAGFKTFIPVDGLPDNYVNALLFDHDSRLWVGTLSGVAFNDNGQWHVLTTKDGLINDNVNVMLQDRSGGMWFGSYVAPRGGISYLKDDKWQTFSTGNGLPHNNITSLFEDSSGSVWAGTGLLDRGGAVKFVSTEKGWVIQQVLTKRDGLAGEKVRSVFQDRDGVMWVGSEYDGLTRFDHGQWSVLTMKDGLAAQEVTCMLQDVDGNLWIGTPDGLTRLSFSALEALR